MKSRRLVPHERIPPRLHPQHRPGPATVARLRRHLHVWPVRQQLFAGRAWALEMQAVWGVLCGLPAEEDVSQSRILSAVESCANVVVGFGVALLSQLAIFPLFDIHLPLSSNLAIGAWFTAISLVRSYVLRRWFNGLRFKR